MAGNVDGHAIPHLVRQTIPWWSAVFGLPDVGRDGQRWGVDDVAELAGEVLGGGPAETDRDDGLVVAAAQADEPHVTGGAAAAAG